MTDKELYNEPCPTCGGQTYLTHSGPHIKWSCEKCGYIKFLPQKTTAFIMPFGKYKGYSLQEIKDSDIDYCVWAAENLQATNIKMKFKEILTEL